MRTFWLTWFVGILAVGTVGFAREEVVTTPDGQQVVINVPPGLNLRASERNESMAIVMENAERSLMLTLIFPPQAANHFSTAANREAYLSKMSQSDIEQSVEQKLEFKSFDGSGQSSYFVLTDGNLVDRTPPPNQYLKLTRGVRVSGSLAVFFAILSQSATSSDYRAAMEVARSGVRLAETKP